MKIQFLIKAIDLVPDVLPHLGNKARYVYGTGRPEYKTADYMLRQVEGLVRGVYSGAVGGQFIDIMANLISGQMTQAYRQAYEDAGYTGEILPDYLTTSLETLILNQYNYVDQFYRAVVDARIDGTSIDPLLARAQMWANRWNEAYNEAIRLITLQGGGNLIWVYSPEKDHCSECESLDGIVMRASEWDVLGVKPQNAPNNKLSCGGWNCGCSLEPTDKRRSPNAFGRVEDIIAGR